MAELIYLVGLPGSGKSTYANKLKEKGYKVFSSDSIRKELYGDENIQGDGNKVFNILHKRISENLKNDVNCIYDSTGISSKRRMSFLNSISHIKCVKTCILFAIPYEICLERNSKRDRKVPEDVVKRMYMNFWCPQYFEGWDDIKIIYENETEIKPNFKRHCLEHMYIKNMKGFNQNNPHHVYDVFDHSKALAYQYKHESIMRVVAMLHDCMKKHAETIDKNGVSHYYNHANISCYYVLSHPKLVDCSNTIEFLKILFFINYHMLLKNSPNSKTTQKYKKIFGEDLYCLLEEFNEKDNIASNQVMFNKNKKNIYIYKDDIAVGYTRLGDIFYIDKDDIDIASLHSWCYKDRKNNDNRLVAFDNGKNVFLHRFILGLNNEKYVVDHINHNVVDNTRKNLRICSQKQNSYNTSLSKNNTSGFNGVSKMKNGKYRAYINQDYRQIHLGFYDTAEDAKEARDKASIEKYGEFANLKI